MYPTYDARSKGIKYSEYRELLRVGKRIYRKACFICYMPFPRMVIKVGASKKVGGAVIRNRQKRLVRNLFPGLCFKGNFLVLIVCLRKDPDIQVSLRDSLLSKSLCFA